MIHINKRKKHTISYGQTKILLADYGTHINDMVFMLIRNIPTINTLMSKKTQLLILPEWFGSHGIDEKRNISNVIRIVLDTHI